MRIFPRSFLANSLMITGLCMVSCSAETGEWAEQPVGSACFSVSGALDGDTGSVPEAVDYESYSSLVIPPLQPQETLDTFELEEGFRIELVAHEPMVTDPVAMDIDHRGRLWVVDMPSFMPVHDKSERETVPLQQVPEARLVVLEDTTGDGVMDRYRVFRDGLTMPRAVKVLHDGVLVGEPPNVWLIRDTTGDGKGDSRERVYGGYGNPETDNIQNMPNNLMLGMDNWIHSSHDYVDSIRRIQGEWHTRAFKRLGQWGMNQDDWGRLYSAHNTAPLLTHLVPYGYSDRHPLFDTSSGKNRNIAPNEPMWPAHATGLNRGYRVGEEAREDGTLKRATATTAPVIYRGSQFGGEYLGNAFTPEPAGNLIKRYIIDSDPAEIEATARFAYEGREFLTSTDERFRPVNMYNAPDGSIYVIDMYRGLFETALSLTDHLREYTVKHDLHRANSQFGRIWRIVRETDETPPALPDWSELRPYELAELLTHDNGWHRDKAQQIIVECAPRGVVQPLEELVRNRQADARARLHALWALEGLSHSIYEASGLYETALYATQDEHPRVRAAAIRILEPEIVNGRDEVFVRLGEMVDSETSPYVRLQLMASLGESAGEQALEWITALLATHIGSPYFREMALTGVYNRESRLAEKLRRHYERDENHRKHYEEILAALSEAERYEPDDIAPAHLTDEERDRFAEGRERYRTCMACHGRDGQGVDGAGTSLVGSDWVTGDPESVIKITLHGFSGGAREQGEEMSAVMPGHGWLTDGNIAAILTYIRQSWGHDASPVEPDQVGRIRDEIGERRSTWSPSELRE